MEQQQAGTWDSVEACLECITTCSVDDGECVTTCVRTHLGEEEELWTSSLCPISYTHLTLPTILLV